MQVFLTVLNKLQQTYYYFKSLNWGQQLLSVVVVLLTVAFIFRLITPDLAEVQPQVLKNVVNTEVNLQNIEFRGTYPRIPDQMPIASAEYTDVTDPLLNNIFTAFSVSRTPEVEGVWSGNSYTVVEVQEPHIITLTRSNTYEVDVPFQEDINTQRGVQEATKIVEGLYSFGPKPEVLLESVEVLNDESQEIDSHSEEPFIKIPFAYTIEGIPALVGQDTTYPVEIILDSSYVLVKATFTPYTLEISTNKNYRTVEPSEAVARINQDEGAIVYYAYFGPNAADFSSINSGILTEARLEYRLDPTTNTLVPYYNFGGVIKNSAGYDIESNIITPALRTDFSSAP